MAQNRVIHHCRADYIIQPWKNSQGQTAEIAKCHCPDNPDDFIWRLSIATISQDGPFSVFPGIDRTLMLLSGKGIDLCFPPGHLDHRLDEIGRHLSFDGADQVDCHLIDGETTDFNVMTRRETVRHDFDYLNNIQHPQKLRMRGQTLLVFSLAKNLSVLFDDKSYDLEQYDTLEINANAGEDIILSPTMGAACALIHIHFI